MVLCSSLFLWGGVAFLHPPFCVFVIFVILSFYFECDLSGCQVRKDGTHGGYVKGVTCMVCQTFAFLFGLWILFGYA